MIETIVNFLQSVVGVIVEFFTGLKNIVEFLFSGSTIIFTVLSFFPAIIISFASLTVIILIIKFVIGRANQ